METHSRWSSSTLHIFKVRILVHLLRRSYEESKKRIEAYSRAIAKYDFLSQTGGYEKRADGSPVCLPRILLILQIQTMGHFMKNSMPLLLSQFAVWRLNGTVVPLYDTLGIEAIT